MEKYFPNLQEVLYYDAIYSLALKEGNGSFCGKGAVSFFKKSNLSMEEIKTIWVAILQETTGEVSKDQFRLIMRLIALSQEGYPPSRKSIVNFANKPVQYAEIEGIPVFVPVNRVLRHTAVQAFKEMNQNGIIDAATAITYMKEKDVPKEDLKQIWKFVDISNEMEINFDQWEIYVLLCAAVLQGVSYTSTLLLDIMDNQPESLSKQTPPAKEMDPFDFLSFTMPVPETSDSVPTTNGFDFFSQQNDGTVSSSMAMEGSDVVSIPTTENVNPIVINEQSMNLPVMGESMTEELGKPSLKQESGNPSIVPLTQEPMISSMTEEPVNTTIIEEPTEPTEPVVMNEVPVSPPLVEEPVNPSANSDIPIMEQTSSVNNRETVKEPSQITEPFSFFSLSDSPPTEPAIEVIPQPDMIPKPAPAPALVPTPTPTAASAPTVPTKEWIKKANIVWARVAVHVMQAIPEDPPSLKAIIRHLRSLDVDIDLLKEVVRLVFNEFGEMTNVNQVVVTRILVLLKNQTVKPSVPLYLCDIPILEGDKAFFQQAEDALLRIREEITQQTPPPPPPQPKKDFVETTRELYEELIRKSDFREIEKLESYVQTLQRIKDLMDAHAPVETVRKLQKSIPTPVEIRKRYTERKPIPNIVEDIHKRLDDCDPQTAMFTRNLLPDDPFTYIDMNDLHSYLMSVKRVHYYTMIVELACVGENEQFPQYWMMMMTECQKIVEECQKWIDSVDQDIKKEVMTHIKTREMVSNASYAVKVAERINECLMVIGKEMDGCLKKIQDMYNSCLKEFNQYQQESSRLMYEPMVFDYSTAMKCDFCLHHCESDRDFVVHLGRSYHPECANMWIHSIDKTIPVFTSKEESMY